jgi:hypothetical protein
MPEGPPFRHLVRREAPVSDVLDRPTPGAGRHPSREQDRASVMSLIGDLFGALKFQRDVLTRLDSIEARLITLTAKGDVMAGELDDLQREVSENGDAVQSAIALLNGLKARLDEAIASGNMARVAELSAQLGRQTDALAAAVTANTPQG